MSEGFLIKQEKYLEAGIHIGTKMRVLDMRKFIYRTRNDGLYVLDLRKIDSRIRIAAKMLSNYSPEKIVVVASRTYSSMAAKKFARLTGAKVISGRFMPGTFTNPSRDDFTEPEIVLVCDPKGEHQAVIEVGKAGIPAIGLCDTDNFTTFIDWVVPCNNKGRRSLSLIFWLLARELAMVSGKISSYDEFKPTLEEFEAMPAEVEEEKEEEKVGEENKDEAGKDETDTEVKDESAPAKAEKEKATHPKEEKEGEAKKEGEKPAVKEKEKKPEEPKKAIKKEEKEGKSKKAKKPKKAKAPKHAHKKPEEKGEGKKA